MMQNSLSFSIESIISRTDPPRQRENDWRGSFCRGPLSAMQNLVELTPRGGYYLEEVIPSFEIEQEKSQSHSHEENLLKDASSYSLGKLTLSLKRSSQSSQSSQRNVGPLLALY